MNKILVVPPRGIGDLIHALPLIHSLKRAFQEAEISIPVVDIRQEQDSRQLKGLLNNTLSFSYRQVESQTEAKRIELYRKGNSLKQYFALASEKAKFEKELYEYYLRGEEWDVAVVLKNFKISSIFSSRQYNFNDIPRVEFEHVVDRNLRLAQAIGIPAVLDFRLNLGPNTTPVVCAGHEVSLPQQYVILVLSAGRADKRWNLEGMREVTRFCTNRGYVPFLVGAAEEYASSKELEKDGAINLISPKEFCLDLQNFGLLAARSNAVIGPDTGLVHLADAVGSKVVGLYGPTRPSKFAPYHNKKFVVSTNHTSGLMSDIKPLMVTRKLEDLLLLDANL